MFLINRSKTFTGDSREPGALRMVGAAIMSIPIFGWIAAAIGVIISAVSYFSNKATEAKKSVDEFNEAVAQQYSDTISKIELLSANWKALGNDMNAKKKFIKQNKKEFEASDSFLIKLEELFKFLQSRGPILKGEGQFYFTKLKI